jgi:hypothetical protein
MSIREYEAVGRRLRDEAREHRERKRIAWVEFCAARGIEPGKAFLAATA